jgi:diguanylate cyclase (GGDEF)-like protein
MQQLSTTDLLSDGFAEAGARNGDGAGFAALTRCFAEDLGADSSLLAVWEDGGPTATVLGGCGLEEFGWPELVRGSGLVGRLHVSRTVAFGSISDSPVDSAGGNGNRAPTGDEGDGARINFAAAAPVRPPDGTRGVLCAGFVQRPDLDHHAHQFVLRTAGAYASAAALCFNGDGGLSGLLRAGRQDGLTGCLNYAGVMEALRYEINRCSRHGGELACCFIDLDEFKQVNAAKGHLGANKVLTAVGEALRSGVRDFDSVGRFGGDEFLVILPETGEQGASDLAVRLLSGLGSRVEETTGDPITASAGVASWSSGLSPEELVARADHALVVAKAGSGAVSDPADGLGPGHGTVPLRRTALAFTADSAPHWASS